MSKKSFGGLMDVANIKHTLRVKLASAKVNDLSPAEAKNLLMKAVTDDESIYSLLGVESQIELAEIANFEALLAR